MELRSFVLTPGRSGSTTFAKACSHIENYTSAHESKTSDWRDRFDYPDSHIEVDPRFAWWLGTLDKKYGDNPVYVWLRRDPHDVAMSTAKRIKWSQGAINHWPYVAYLNPNISPIEAAPRMISQIENNIELFLKDKTKVVEVWIEQPYESFAQFWEMVEAEGNFASASREFDTRHNRS